MTLTLLGWAGFTPTLCSLSAGFRSSLSPGWVCLCLQFISLSASDCINSTLSLCPSLTVTLVLQVSLSPSVSVDVSSHSVPRGQSNIVLCFSPSFIYPQRSPALTTATMSSVAHPAQPAAHPQHGTKPQLHVMDRVWRDASVTRALS